MNQFELVKSGKTKFGLYWGYGTFTSDLLTYTGIVYFKEAYNLTDGSIYEVKSIHLNINKKGVLQITLALK